MANSWYENLNVYIRLGEPKLKKKAAAWQTAIGLQAVDGLDNLRIFAGNGKREYRR